MSELKQNSLNEDQSEALNAIKMNRIILPIIIGIAIIIYLMMSRFDINAFREINWDTHAFIWICMGILCYVLRHFAYSWRLRELSNGDFSWKKSIELIFIWEFASAVSPTSLGGSAVALFLLAQEKISSARSVSMVLYSVVIDTLFFVLSVPLLYIILGPIIIRPGANTLADLDSFGNVLFILMAFMSAYGILFFYGLFINPTQLKRFFLLLSKIAIFKRFKTGLRQTALDIVTTSTDLKKQALGFHINVFVSTALAWIFRFLCLNCLIIGIIATTKTDLWSQLVLYARGQSMFILTAFTPSPGGAGFAEGLFGGFLTDFVPEGLSTIMAIIWRVITYYTYLFAGVIIVPIWVRKLINRRKMDQAESNAEPS